MLYHSDGMPMWAEPFQTVSIEFDGNRIVREDVLKVTRLTRHEWIDVLTQNYTEDESVPLALFEKESESGVLYASGGELLGFVRENRPLAEQTRQPDPPQVDVARVQAELADSRRYAERLQREYDLLRLRYTEPDEPPNIGNRWHFGQN